MSKKIIDFLLVGGGYASAIAAETLRREGATGSILIISADANLPYRRPDLSKAYLLGKVTASQISLFPPGFYQEHNIEIMLNTAVISVHADEKYVKTSTGEQIYYQKMLLATGSKAKDFSGQNGDLPGIYKLRSQADCEVVRQKAADSKSVLICGGDFKGFEIVMSFNKMGLKTTVVEQDDSVLPHIRSRHISEFFREYAEEKGVSVHLGESITAFVGTDKLTGAITSTGRRIECDLAILCIGEEPIPIIYRAAIS